MYCKLLPLEEHEIDCSLHMYIVHVPIIMMFLNNARSYCTCMLHTCTYMRFLNNAHSYMYLYEVSK